MLQPRRITNLAGMAPRQAGSKTVLHTALPAGIPSNENSSNILQNIPEGAGGTSSVSPESGIVVQEACAGMASSQPR